MKHLKATRENAIAVIDLWHTSTESPRNIADHLGISKNAVMRIVNGVVFKDIKRPSNLPDWRYKS